MSRPMYTVISSGVEQDRTGVRGNDMHEPAATRSVWEEARGAGWPVRAVSSVGWWKELFPAGFDDYLTPPSADDYFKDVRADALNLVHVLYVDDAGHANGAGSVEYVASVHRADAELSDLIARSDLRTSLLVLTADHGQALRGGHGGSQPRVATVMTCFNWKERPARHAPQGHPRDGHRARRGASRRCAVPRAHAGGSTTISTPCSPCRARTTPTVRTSPIAGRSRCAVSRTQPGVARRDDGRGRLPGARLYARGRLRQGRP